MIFHNPNAAFGAAPSDTARAVRSYIEKYHMDYYDDVLREENRFPVFSELTVLRTGLISWYPFEKGAEALEIGAGFGALTGALCDKCAHVTATERSSFRAETTAMRWGHKENLTLYAGEWSEIEFESRFDYIILSGILEKACKGGADKEAYASWLRKVKGLLKPDGILLAAVENRFGLKYFCGAVERHSKKAFGGINGYPGGTGGHSFGRRELMDIIEGAGFDSYRFFYPLPDYRLPQIIYSDEYLPEKNLHERLIPYDEIGGTRLAVELDLYNDAVENNVFPFFANSFLTECRNGVQKSDVLYAAISTDRGLERGFATTIYQGDVVLKTPLFPEGSSGVARQYENLERLRQRCVPVVDHTLCDGSLKMPRVMLPTLSNYFKELPAGAGEHFESILEELYQWILASSVAAEADENRLLKSLCDKTQDKDEKAKLKNMDWGPVLKTAYIEMIPLNCFYDEAAGRLLFFDQEFIREGYPAKYVLFRAIHYTYAFVPNAGKLMPRNKLIEKYEMTDTWNYYLQEEKEFLKEVRNQEKYAQLCRWSKTDRKEIYENYRKLQSEEEKIAEYRVSGKMKKIWKTELEMLDQVKDICERHNLSYFMIHGTLLGAVRHRGFIPWDDDLDIGMLREDYDKFMEAASQELKEPLVLQNMWTEKDCFFGAYTRIRNSETTGIQVQELGHKSNQGIWIDILPFGPVPADEALLKKQVGRISRYYTLLYAKVYGKQQKRFMRMPTWRCMINRLAAKLYTHEKLCARLENAVKPEQNIYSDHVAVFGYGMPRLLHRADFESTVLLDFEHRKVPAPAGYENYLFCIMGKDYMKYPPEEERKPKHAGIFDPDRPYTEYARKLSGLFDDAKDRQIIVFGAGLMFQDYMKKWGGRYRPSFIVDNDENKWGTMRMGIPVRKPEDILTVPESKRRLIICSYYYREIEPQLKEMGVQDYRVYVQQMEWILQAEKQET